MKRVPSREAVFAHTLMALVRNERPDLTTRQLAVFYACYRADELQTVRGLAAFLNISKPAVTRALDRLQGLNFIRRTVDPRDRRSIFVMCTTQGRAYRDFVRDTLAGATVSSRQTQVA